MQACVNSWIQFA